MHSLLRHIYAKTEKGQDEIVRPKFGLNPRQRRLLNGVDGTKALAALRENFPLQEMEDIVSILSGEHFIRLVGENPEEAFSVSHRGPSGPPYRLSKHQHSGRPGSQSAPWPVLTQDAERIRKAREFMLEIAAIHLGILGRDIVRKIDTAEGSQSLASLAGQWAMALCASKTAGRYAQLYLEQLKLILFEEGQDLLSPPLSELSSRRHMPSV